MYESITHFIIDDRDFWLIPLSPNSTLTLSLYPVLTLSTPNPNL